MAGPRRKDFQELERIEAREAIKSLIPSEGDAALTNIEMEQALLGILLFDNATMMACEGTLQDHDFAEPFHRRLYGRIAHLIRVGRLAEPVILNHDFSIDPAYHDLGGIRYLADLVDRAPPPSNAKPYAESIRSLALRREVIRICSTVAMQALGDTDATGAQLMATMEAELLATKGTTGEMELTDWREVSAGIVYGMDRPDEKPLLKVGLSKLDEATGGLERGDLVVLGARPSMGKSALAGCIAMNMAKQGLGVIEINGEMSKEQMGRRHLTDHAFTLHGIKAPVYRDIRRKNLTQEQMAILREVDHDLAMLPLKMLKRTGLTLGHLRAMLRRQKILWDAAGVPMSLVVIDHVGLVRPDEGGRGRTEDQTIVSGTLKEMADELDVVILALAQLNRKVEDRDDKRPQLSDLRDSGSWEQDADIVMGAYRDAYYARREREPKSQEKLGEWVIRCGSPTVEVLMMKIREGDVATAKLWADIGRNAIRDSNPEDYGEAFGQAQGFDFSGGYQPR